MKHDLPVFALLIDADNVTKDAIAPIIEEVTRHGRIAVRRVYGDFTTPNLAGWRETLANHGIHPIQQYRNSIGKNASDSALIIDAMDLLHSGRLEGFCLVSSDGDFSRLATRIRENGLSVFGFGRKDAAKAFVNACERYIYIENLLNPSEPAKETAPLTPNKSPPPLESTNNLVAIEPPKNLEPLKPIVTKNNLRIDQDRLQKLLTKAYTKVADESDWVLVSRIDQYLRANHSDFDPRTYGASTFPKLLATINIFEIILRKQGNGQAQFCCLTQRIKKTSAEKKSNLQTPLPTTNTVPVTYIDALKSAVAANRSVDGWSSIANIRVHLHQHGQRLEDSNHERLEFALKAAGIFDMREVSGASKEFRLSTSKSPSTLLATCAPLA